MIRVTYTCVKVVFQNKQLAVQRANEINAEDSVKKKGYKFWAYRCPMCLNYHLTKMDRLLAKWINDIAYRNKMREEAFVQREAAYYNKRNNIKE